MNESAIFKNIEGLAYFAKLRASRRIYNGKFGLMAQRVVEQCTHTLGLDGDRIAMVTYVRETGDQSCGWWAQPHLRRSRRLSIVFRSRTTWAILPHDSTTSLKIAEAVFAEQANLIWCEAASDGLTKPAGYWHYRLFCDGRGRASPLQETAFTRENAGNDWVRWADLRAQQLDMAA